MWIWSAFVVYLILTAFLAVRGGRQTSAASTFAIGDGRMNPLLVGITLGACMASSSLFLVMPGFVYANGLPALLGFSVPLVLGFAVGLLVLAPRFQTIGRQTEALTVPQWLGARYGSAALRRLFAVLGLLQVAYVVMVVVATGYLMRDHLGLSYQTAIVLVVVFVFAYTGFGGAWAHAFTNSVQGSLMLLVSILVFTSGWSFWQDGSLWRDLAASGWTAPGSVLFSSHIEIWLVQFVLGVVLMSQPHLLTKALYVQGRRSLLIVGVVAIGVFLVYALVLFAGAYARHVLPAGVPQDQAVSRYLSVVFGEGPLGALIVVAILAASMSTLDGLLVAISASVAGDLLPDRYSGQALWPRRVVMVVLAAITMAIASHPPRLVLLLSQQGVFGLVAAATGPLIAGLFLGRGLSAPVAMITALVGCAVHFGLVLSSAIKNPCVAANLALLASVPLPFVWRWLQRGTQP